MTEQQAMRMALEALEKIERTVYHVETPPVESLEEQMRRIASKAITALRQALEQQPTDEPVAWTESDWHYQLHKKGMVVAHKDKEDVLVGEPQPLYTRSKPAAKRKPLTDEEVQFIYADSGYNDIQMFARAIEAAHGITGEQA